jgi:hypothetical protein
MPVKTYLQREASRKRQLLIYLPRSVNLGHKLLFWRRPADDGVMELDSKLMIRIGLQGEPLAKLLNMIAVLGFGLLNDTNLQGQWQTAREIA